MGVTVIGNSAFEGCGGLTSAFLPASVTTVGERAFAFCYSMTNFIMTGEPTSVGAWAFKNCRSLSRLVFRTTTTEAVFASDSFEGAGLSFADAILTDNESGASTLIIRYVIDGEVVESKTETYPYGTDYSVPTPTREGYTADQLTVTGTANGASRDVTVTYTANEVAEKETEATTEAAPEEKEPVSATSIIAIVIMGVVLVAIAVGAFLLMRSDKKDAKKGSNKGTAFSAKNTKKSGK
jgi:hypothetical protein